MSRWLDATNPNLSAFFQRGGKLIVTTNTDDTRGSPASQLNYMQAVIDRMGRDVVDQFARFWIFPMAPHSTGSGTNSPIDGNGNTIPALPLPVKLEQSPFLMLTGWVEQGVAPGKSLVASSSQRSRPICSFPEYPRYIDGDVNQASSYRCVQS